ncbi:MAG: 16S rRNA (cytosine(967)-C(5))-methyltransferase RsmB [Candidatus Sulfotelmatobacter sp.]
MPVSPARAAAFDILLRVEREYSYASELLHSAAYQRLSVPDHALATELVMGVLRWRSRLDDEIAKASSMPLSKLDLEVLISLRLAAYQFGWLDRVPKHAALNESVELVKRARKRSATGFVNAVLRKLAASKTAAPIPKNEDSSAESLARLSAHPAWIVERWVKEYGIAVAKQICEYDQLVPATVIRMRTPAAERNLQDEGVNLAPGALMSSAHRVLAGDITKTICFRAHSVVIQDEASQLVAALVGNGERILDCCAAPGGKTLAIADRNPSASIVAAEVHPHRARLMRQLMRTPATAIHPIHVLAADARSLPVRPQFDRILSDVPCSGTGTIARNPEIKWRLKPDDLAELHTRQAAILRSALSHLTSGGRLVYSTCSLENEENENVVDEILSDNSAIRVVDCGPELERLKAEGELVRQDLDSLVRGPYLRTIPGVHPCDGFFAAILERS